MSYYKKFKKNIDYITDEKSLQYFAFNLIDCESEVLRYIWNGYIIERAGQITMLINQHIYYLIAQKTVNSNYDLFSMIYSNSKNMYNLLKDLQSKNSSLVNTESNKYKFSLDQYLLLNENYKKYYKFRVFMLKNYLNDDVLNYILDFFY